MQRGSAELGNNIESGAQNVGNRIGNTATQTGNALERETNEIRREAADVIDPATRPSTPPAR